MLKDYLEHNDTIPPEVGRNGEGTMTFNTSSDVMSAALDYLKTKHGDEDVGAPQTNERDPAFYVQLYKMALCFGCVVQLQRPVLSIRKLRPVP